MKGSSAAFPSFVHLFEDIGRNISDDSHIARLLHASADTLRIECTAKENIRIESSHP